MSAWQASHGKSCNIVVVFSETITSIRAVSFKMCMVITSMELFVYVVFCVCQDSDLILMTVHNIVSQTLSHWESSDFRDVEMALTLLYSVAEAVPVSPVICFLIPSGCLVIFLGVPCIFL